MNKEYIINKVNEILVEEFEIEQEIISPDALLHETMELDSLDYVDLVVLIESNFGVKVNGEDFKEIKTFENFYDFILQKAPQES